MALSQTQLDRWIAEHGPYLYHGTYDELVDQILREGLKPGWSADVPSTHVFLGEKVADTWASIRGAKCNAGQIKVDLRLLDPANIDADPDIYLEDWMLIEDGCFGLAADGQIVAREDVDRLLGEEPAQWAAIDLYYLAKPSSPEDTLRSLKQGTCSYRGVVPTKALELSPTHARVLTIKEDDGLAI